MRKRNFNKLDK